MKDHCYLVVNARGVHRMTKQKPRLNQYEIAVKVNVSVDNKCFAAMTEANIAIDENNYIKPDIDIQADVDR